MHNRSRIAEAKAAAEAAGASEAGSSRTGPSVRDRSNPRPSMLAALTTRCLAQRTASVTALARTLGCAPKTLTELVDEAAEDNRSQTLSRIDAKLAPPDLTDLALPTGRTLAHLRSCVCVHRSRIRLI